MSVPAIEVSNLGKQYTIGERESYHVLRDVMANAARHPLRALARRFGVSEAAPMDTIWALRNVSFSLAEGQALGVVGMNGSGKTTLLRLLTRITDPTEGRAVIRGRVSSLLEVGTGFHPELTGRENILVNGVLLGMRRQDILRRQGEIVEFSGIEQFIDTPVKHYSSGMQLRLAFSVAAHLEPEIVLIDEVLAVGDVAFQMRCITKMQEMAKSGRTIVYVSHNLPSVAKICDRALILDKGTLVSDGPAGEAIESYVKLAFSETEKRDRAQALEAAALTGAVRLLDVALVQNGVEGIEQAVDISRPLIVRMRYQALEPGHRLFSVIHLHDQHGTAILSSGDLPGMSAGGGPTVANRAHEPGEYVAECEIPANFLNDKRYHITAIVSELPDTTHVLFAQAITFDVRDTGEMRRHYHGEDWLGCIRPKLAWRTVPAK